MGLRPTQEYENRVPHVRIFGRGALHEHDFRTIRLRSEHSCGIPGSRIGSWGTRIPGYSGSS